MHLFQIMEKSLNLGLDQNQNEQSAWYELKNQS